ncbi:MAG: hypothetical protein AAGA54_01015 [Myxococcota bacterium]
MMKHLGFAVVATLGGCTLNAGEDDGFPSAAGTSTGSEPAGSSDSSTTGEVTVDEGSSSTTSTAPKLDVGAPETDADLGCSAVDFLFVVDSSESMREEQENLVQNFPAFIGGIESTLDNVSSFHVGVIATSPYAFNNVACQDLGALITQTGGNNSSATVCSPYASGENYMTEADELATKFACAAQVGTLGSGMETPLDAIENAVDGSLAGPGGCNEGFLRDDALLVIVIITDEGGEDAQADADHYVDVVEMAKLGNKENAVVVTFLNPLTINVRLRTFTQSFLPNAFEGNVSEDYADSFAQAVEVVGTACQNFAG